MRILSTTLVLAAISQVFSPSIAQSAETSLVPQEVVKEANDLLKDGGRDAALEKLNAVIEAHPTYPRAYRLRGNLYFVKKDYKNALKDFSKVIELSPENGKAFFDRGITHLVMGDDELGLIDVKRAYKLDPELMNNAESTKFVKEKLEALTAKQNPKKIQVKHKQGAVKMKKNKGDLSFKNKKAKV